MLDPLVFVQGMNADTGFPRPGRCFTNRPGRIAHLPSGRQLAERLSPDTLTNRDAGLKEKQIFFFFFSASLRITSFRVLTGPRDRTPNAIRDRPLTNRLCCETLHRATSAKAFFLDFWPMAGRGTVWRLAWPGAPRWPRPPTQFHRQPLSHQHSSLRFRFDAAFPGAPAPTPMARAPDSVATSHE